MSPEGKVCRAWLAQPLSLRDPRAPEQPAGTYVAFERSCARYGAVKSSLGEPDPFRLRYRSDIKAIVREIVLAGKTIQEADDQIRAYADTKLPKEARTRFRTVVETELASPAQWELCPLPGTGLTLGWPGFAGFAAKRSPRIPPGIKTHSLSPFEMGPQ